MLSLAETSHSLPPMGSGEDPGASASRIDALVRLLGDEDPKICSVAWDNLERIGAPALPLIAETMRRTDDARVRVQSGRFLKEWSRREVFRRWVDFAKGGNVDLEEGAFLIAETEYPEADMKRYREALDGYASVLRRRLPTARTTDEAVRMLSKLLFGELGFKGNAEDYGNPDNSYLNRVIDSKRGIPITLSTVFIAVARRLSLPVHGVGMPFHFLVKYRGPSGEIFLDAFHGGRPVSARECAAILAREKVPIRDDHLRAVSDQEILARMLGNLLRVYLKADDQRRCERISAMLKLLS
jgi:regulator of sirC expression with transglutaminase-like and TPR domain